jgi:predicted PilT family ATPase
MSETAGAPAEGAENTGTQEQQQGDPADKPLGPNGEKALQSERDARKAAEKAAADYKAQLDQIEQANLSEIEKAQRAAQEAQDQLAAITRENTRNAVALSKGVPADLVEFLTGDTEEEIAAKADTLLARLKGPTTPKPDPTQGAAGDGKGSTAAQFAAALSSI